MDRIIILGIGNRLMMDDGIGIYSVEELIDSGWKTEYQYIIGESDIDYCLEKIENTSFVIVIDAVFMGKNTGETSVFPLESLNQKQSLSISPHNFHLFQALYQQKDKRKGFLIGIEPFEITFNMGLSKPIQDQWDIILESIKDNIELLVKPQKQNK